VKTVCFEPPTNKNNLNMLLMFLKQWQRVNKPNKPKWQLPRFHS